MGAFEDRLAAGYAGASLTTPTQQAALDAIEALIDERVEDGLGPIRSELAELSVEVEEDVEGLAASVNNLHETMGDVFERLEALEGSAPPPDTEPEEPEPPVDPDPPVEPEPVDSILDVALENITQTSVRVLFSLSRPAPGRSWYRVQGTTTWFPGPNETSSNYANHVQTISSLIPGVIYEVQVEAFGTWSDIQQFTTLPATQPQPPVEPQPPTQPPASARTYGPAMNSDSKDNYRLRGTAEANASRLFGIRWRPTTTSQLKSIALPFRWANNGSYSDNYPRWGHVRLRIMPELNGRPNFSNILATEVYVPSTMLNLSGVSTGVGELYYPIPFSPSPTLQEGVAYYCIIDNDHPGANAAGAESISINTNHIWSSGYGSGLARPFGSAQPRWDPDDFALVTPAGGGFLSGASISGYSIPICDIAYADGTVDGWTTPHNVSFPYVRDIGGSSRVRERFVARRAVTVKALWARVGRWQGSGDLAIELRLASGSLVAGGTAAGSGSSTTFWDRVDATKPNGSWVEVPITPVTLVVGTTYDLVLSAPSGTTYGMVPILWRSSAMVNHMPSSEHFEEGSAQYSTNGGSSWQNMHSGFPSHAQVFMEI